MRLRNQHGVSLIELLVAVVVFAVLILVIDAVFISAHRGTQKAELAADVNQNARIAIERLTTEIRESSATLVSLGGTPDADGNYPAVVFRSARPADASNSFCLHWASPTEPLALANPGCAGTPNGSYAPNWQRWIGYYLEAGSVKRITSRTALNPNTLADSCAVVSPPDTCQVIATSVRTFAVSPPSGSPPALTIALEGEGEVTVQGSSVPQQEIVLKVTTALRN